MIIPKHRSLLIGYGTRLRNRMITGGIGQPVMAAEAGIAPLPFRSPSARRGCTLSWPTMPKRTYSILKGSVNEIVILQTNLGLCVPRGGPWPGVRPPPQRRKKPLSLEDARSRPHTSRQMAEEGGRRARGREQRTEGKERRALRREPEGVRLAVMKRTDSSGAGSRWPIIPNGKIDRTA